MVDQETNPWFETPTAPSSPGLTVERENMLDAARIIEARADELHARFRRLKRTLVVEPPGQDAVSREAAGAWNYRLTMASESPAARVEQYLHTLRNLAESLRDNAPGEVSS